MDRDRVLLLATAFLAICALWIAAGTVEGTMDDGPDDLMDTTYVPIIVETIDQIRPELERTSSDTPDKNDGEETAQLERAAEDESPPERSAPMRGPSTDPSGDESNDGDDDSLRDEHWILGLWRPLIIGLLCLAIAAFLVRRGIHLHSTPSSSRDDSTQDRDARTHQLLSDQSPSNAIEAAWMDLVSDLEVTEISSLTTTDIARRAIDSGRDPERVWAVTQTFDEIQYGNKPVTDARMRRVRSKRTGTTTTGMDG